MTSLRTSKGINLELITERFGEEHAQGIIQDTEPFIENKWVVYHNHTITLSQQGKLFADHIAAELFVDVMK